MHIRGDDGHIAPLRSDPRARSLLENADAIPIRVSVDDQITRRHHNRPGFKQNAIFGVQLNIAVTVNCTSNNNRPGSVGHLLCGNLRASVLRKFSRGAQSNLFCRNIAVDLDFFGFNRQFPKQDHIFNNLQVCVCC